MSKFLARQTSTQKRALYRRLLFAAIVSLAVFIIYSGSSSSTSTSGHSPIHANSHAKKDSGYKVVDENGLVYHYAEGDSIYTGPKVKAAFVTLARNSDLYDLIPSIKEVEDRFNRKFQYDWIFLNDDEFTDEFKEVTTALISGTTKYGKIPHEHWSVPDWIDEAKAAAGREQMLKDNVIYGGSIPYRHMCRFESGFFYRHELMDEYDWYWRVEPSIQLHCDIDYDIFKFMADNNKKYGFTISIHEYPKTIPTLWQTTKDFMAKHPEFISSNNMMDFISDDNGVSYNNCHFWSNFEIASLDLWRGPAYSAYFEYLDKAGGFFYERWGDAPIHSIAAALFLDRDQIHHFNDVGYYHGPFHACTIDKEVRLRGKCNCNPDLDFTWNGFSCGQKFYTVNNLEKPEGWQLYTNKKL